MNLFRSEEHVRNWSGFKPDSDEGIMPLSDLARLFSSKHMTKRLDPDYISRDKYAGDLAEAIAEIAKSRPFWSPLGQPPGPP
jgi:hypothetical protein